jgi:hypothetical protein
MDPPVMVSDDGPMGAVVRLTIMPKSFEQEITSDAGLRGDPVVLASVSQSSKAGRPTNSGGGGAPCRAVRKDTKSAI